MKKITTILLLSLLVSSATHAQITDSSFCDLIGNSYDEFNKETTFNTPVQKECVLTKVVSKKSAVYYLSLTADGSTVNVNIKGVKIILSNKQVLSSPSEEIDVKVSDNGYTYSAFIRLQPDKLSLLKKFKINKWQLYVYDSEQSEADAEAFRNMVNCIVGLKVKTSP